MSGISATLYTDGGCKPSRGRGGWGVHGQIGEFVFDYWGSHKEETTNNAMEVVAATEGLKLGLSREITDLTILSDSHYVLKQVDQRLPTWRENGWVKSNGEEVTNKGAWEALAEAYDQYKEKGWSVTWDYVQGHSGNKGNDAADENATKGVILAQQGLEKRFEQQTEVAKHGKFKPAKYNRMFTHSRLYLASPRQHQTRSEDGRYTYYCGTHGKVLDLIGSPNSDSHHSVLFLKEPEPVVERIKEYQSRAFRYGVELPVIVHMDAVTSPKVYSEVMANGTDHIGKKQGTHNLITHSKKQLTEALRKPLLSHKLIQLYMGLERMLEMHVAGTFKDRVDAAYTDITDRFFTVSESKKPKPILRKEIDSQVKHLDVDAKHRCGGVEGDYKVRLVLGRDIASRNALSALAEKKPKLYLVTWPESDVGFRYMTILETEDDVGLWTAGHANLKLINKHGKRNDGKKSKPKIKKK